MGAAFSGDSPWRPAVFGLAAIAVAGFALKSAGAKSLTDQDRPDTPKTPKAPPNTPANGAGSALSDKKKEKSGKEKGASKTRPTVYIELDGTLCDTNGAAGQFLQRQVQNLDKELGNLQMKKDFFAQLPWLSEGKKLWDGIKADCPVVLSGVPKLWGEQASNQKRRWVKKQLGQNVPVLTSYKEDKKGPCSNGDILIDSDASHRKAWEQKGGKFIHFSGNATATLAQLKILLQAGADLEATKWVQAKWNNDWWWCKVLSGSGDNVQVQFMEPPHTGKKYMMTSQYLR